MGKFFISGDTFRIIFPDGEWCDIKQEFNQTDLDYITSQMMQASVKTDGKKPEAEVAMVFGKQATLERAIVAWSFKEEDKAIPVNAENISNLRSKYRTLILQEIDRLSTENNAFIKN